MALNYLQTQLSAFPWFDLYVCRYRNGTAITLTPLTCTKSIAGFQFTTSAGGFISSANQVNALQLIQNKILVTPGLGAIWERFVVLFRNTGGYTLANSTFIDGQCVQAEDSDCGIVFSEPPPVVAPVLGTDDEMRPSGSPGRYQGQLTVLVLMGIVYVFSVLL